MSDLDHYLLELVRYVHLNPVRAGLVGDPADWPWSGHRAYLGEEQLPWLTTEWVLGQFAGQFTGRVAGARARYRDFVRDGMGEGHRPEFHVGRDDSRVLAEDDFLERVTAWAGRRRPQGPAASGLGASGSGGPGSGAPGSGGPDLTEIVRRVAAAYQLAPGALASPSRQRRLSEARGIVAYLARDSAAATLTQVAARFGRDPATLSHGLRRIESRAAADRDFANRLKTLNNAIMQA